MFSQKTNFNEYILPIRFCYKTPKQTNNTSFKKNRENSKIAFREPLG